MKIAEPAAMAQERAVLRGFAARSLGYACLIAVALASQDAVAQTPPIEVRLLPGETTRTLVAPSAPSFNVLYVASEVYVCNLPTAATINDQLLTDARFGRLLRKLGFVEGVLTTSDASIGRAFAQVDSGSGGLSPSNSVFSSQPLTFVQDRLGNTGTTHTVRSNCLTVPEARAGINEIRRIIRAHLGLPAPTN